MFKEGANCNAKVAIRPMAARLLVKPLKARQHAHASLAVVQRHPLSHMIRGNLLNPLLLKLLGEIPEQSKNAASAVTIPTVSMHLAAGVVMQSLMTGSP